MRLDLVDTVNVIGAELAACRNGCEGVLVDAKQGIIPRGLLLEMRDAEKGAAIVLGMNPGQGDDDERAAFRMDPSYSRSVTFMLEKRLRVHPYYTRLRTLIADIGVNGHLLWTELAKCQNAPGFASVLPDETNRTCTARFLRREVAAMPAESPIFAVGRDAYRAATYLFLDRAVIGLPHPTGSRGHWHGLFDAGRVKDNVRSAINAIIATNRAAWVTDDVFNASLLGDAV